MSLWAPWLILSTYVLEISMYSYKAAGPRSHNTTTPKGLEAALNQWFSTLEAQRNPQGASEQYQYPLQPRDPIPLVRGEPEHPVLKTFQMFLPAARVESNCSESSVVVLVNKLCPTLCKPVHYRRPGSPHGFFRQEQQSGLPFPPPGDLPDPGIKLESPSLVGRFSTTEPPGKPLESSEWVEVSQSRPTLCDPMDCSLPGSLLMEFSRTQYCSG